MTSSLQGKKAASPAPKLGPQALKGKTQNKSKLSKALRDNLARRKAAPRPSNG